MFWTRKKTDIKVAQANIDMRLAQAKIDIIDFAFTTFNLKSFADLGGVWGVDAGYTFYILDKYKVEKAILVDTHPTQIVEQRSKSYQQLRFIKGNFGDEKVAHDVGQVDAILLFDVLLHQVNPNWDRILEMYAPNVKCMVIFNQQWLGSKHTVRLLELGEDIYFQNVPHTKTEEPYNTLFQKLNQKHPDHDRMWKDVHHIWQWGITDVDLQDKIESMGFHMQFFKNCGMCANLKNFENHAYIFKK
jgi:hypothetical protein